MSITAIPHPADLNANEVIVTVRSYDHQFDTFAVHVQDAAPNEGQESLIPGMIMPRIVGQFGDPEEIIGRQFFVEM